jgi:hypothetical protein
MTKQPYPAVNAPVRRRISDVDGTVLVRTEERVRAFGALPEAAPR